MANFCGNCGASLTKSFKFCPECGAKIISSSKDILSDNQQVDSSESTYQKVVDVIICENCGDENPSGNEYCDGCGIELKGAVTQKEIEVKKTRPEKLEPPKPVVYQKIKKNKKKSKTSHKAEVKKEEKEIDSKKIYLIASVIVIFAIVLLVSSGVFDSSSPSFTTTNTVPNQSTGSGIDLGSIQRINDLEAKLNANPNDKKTLLDLANLKFDSGFYDKAIPLYQRYLDIVPEDADARIDMGVCMYNLGDFDNAIKEMTKALEYEPKHQIGHLNLGVVNLTAGNIDVAQEWFKKAIELGPNTDAGKKAKELLNTHNL
jgi:tetratricopeptide (TPR) repeat protein